VTSADPVVALDKLFELAARLGEVMQRGLGERGLTAARAELLLVLHEGGAMVQRQVSQALHCTPRHVTALVDALEAQGWVTRRPHPTDRRATLVVLTGQGAAAATKLDAERQAAARWLFDEVSASDLDAFVAIADRVLERIGGPTPATPDPPPRQQGPGDVGGEMAVRPRPARERRRRPSSTPNRSTPTRERQEGA
jgi:DNA-binding MarR family transcriptional regulator